MRRARSSCGARSLARFWAGWGKMGQDHERQDAVCVQASPRAGSPHGSRRSDSRGESRCRPTSGQSPRRAFSSDATPTAPPAASNLDIIPPPPQYPPPQPLQQQQQYYQHPQHYQQHQHPHQHQHHQPLHMQSSAMQHGMLQAHGAAVVQPVGTSVLPNALLAHSAALAHGGGVVKSSERHENWPHVVLGSTGSGSHSGGCASLPSQDSPVSRCHLRAKWSLSVEYELCGRIRAGRDQRAQVEIRGQEIIGHSFQHACSRSWAGGVAESAQPAVTFAWVRVDGRCRPRGSRPSPPQPTRRSVATARESGLTYGCC